MLNEELLEFKYYADSLSMFLKQSYGILNQFEAYYTILKTIDDAESAIMDGLDITKEDYDVSSATDLLDKIGEILNIKRKFQFSVGGNRRTVNLEDNAEYLLLIKAQIIKNNYNGSFADCKKLYDLAGLPILTYTDPEAGATVNLYLNYSQGSISINIQRLFQGGYLNIESVGINYTYSLVNQSLFGVFVLDETSAATDINKFNKCYFA